jgi:DNA polymerase III subunit delta
LTAKLGPLYLIRGDDHGAIAARRARLRALAESESDGSGLELLEGPEATPERTAQALASLTLALGRRVVIVDGVERWRTKDVEDHLLGAIGQIPPDTTLALFAREESRAKVPEVLVKAVKRAGGQVAVEAAVKPWELPGWTREQAERLGLSLDGRASKALVAQVGERPQRLLRELEKLALSLQEVPPGGGAPRGTGTPGAATPREVTEEEVLRLCARSSEQRGYELADALLEGDRRAALSLLGTLRAQGESLPGLTYAITRRLRDGVAVAEKLAAGQAPAQIKDSLRPMPPRAAERFIAAVRGSDPARLRAALGVLADLELDSRGGSPLPAARRPQNGLEEDSLALRAVEAIAS